METIFWAVAWFALGCAGTFMRCYAFGAQRVTTSLFSDFFYVALGPIGFVIGLANYASVRGLKSR